MKANPKAVTLHLYFGLIAVLLAATGHSAYAAIPVALGIVVLCIA